MLRRRDGGIKGSHHVYDHFPKETIRFPENPQVQRRDDVELFEETHRSLVCRLFFALPEVGLPSYDRRYTGAEPIGWCTKEKLFLFTHTCLSALLAHFVRK